MSSHIIINKNDIDQDGPDSSDVESQPAPEEDSEGASEEGAVHPSTDLFGVGQALWQEGPNILPADLHATIAAQDCSDQCRALLHKLPEARGIVRDICTRPSFQKKKARKYFDCAKDWRRAFEHWGPLLASLINTSKMALLWALSFGPGTSTPERAYHDRPATDPLLRLTLHARVSTDRLHDVALTEAENILFSLIDAAAQAAQSDAFLDRFDAALEKGMVTDLWKQRPHEYDKEAAEYWCGLLDGLPEILAAYEGTHGTESVAAYRHFFARPETLVNLLSHFVFPDGENRRAIPILADYRIPWMSPQVLSRVLSVFSSVDLRPAERALRCMVANIVPAGDLYWSYFRHAEVEVIPPSATSPVAVLEEYIFQMVVRRAGKRPVRRDTSDISKYRRTASALALQIADMVLMASHGLKPSLVRAMGHWLHKAEEEFNSLSDRDEHIDALEAFMEIWTYSSSALSSTLTSDTDVSMWHVPTLNNFVQEYWLKYAQEHGQSFLNPGNPLPFVIDPNGDSCAAAAARRLTEFPADWMVYTEGMSPEARQQWLVTVARMAYSAGQAMYHRILTVLRKERVLGPAYKPWASRLAERMAMVMDGGTDAQSSFKFKPYLNRNVDVEV
ncbi:hypothetical protein FB107DRAFT_280154 [Schizophyllum commune]